MSSNLNPFLPLSRFICRTALGLFMKTESLDTNNVLKNGLQNVRVDPDKVNKMLAGLPIKVVEGRVSEVKLATSTLNAKFEVMLGKVELVAYIDDHSQFKAFHADGANFVEASALGIAAELENEAGGTSGLMEYLLTSCELGVSISSIEIELRTERYVRNASKIILKLDKIDVRKLKQKSQQMIHSISVTLGAFEGLFQQIGEHTPKKFFSFQRVLRKGEPAFCTQALNMTVDILKKTGKEDERKTVIRGHLAAFQCILTVLNSIDIFKVVDKLMLFSLRQTYMDEGISDFLNCFKKMKEEEKLFDVDSGNMDKELFYSVNQPGVFASFYQSYKQSSILKATSNQLSESKQDSNVSSIKSQEILESFKSDFLDSSLDMEFQWQGIYLGVLKVPRFDTDKLFEWISNVDKTEQVNFGGTLYSHFLLRSENYKLTYMDSQKDKVLTIGSFEVVDCISPDQNKKKELIEDAGFGNRVDIQGLDSDSMNMSMSFGSEIFKSAIDFGASKAVAACKEKVMLRLAPLPNEDIDRTSRVVKVKLDLSSVPQVAINIHKILIDFDLETFKLMADRKAMYDEILQICQLVSAERKRGESESHMLNEARLLFEGVDSYTLDKMVSGLTELYACLQNEMLREQLLHEWKIELPHKLSQATTAKVELNVTHIEAKVGGRIDPVAGKSSHLILRTGCVRVLMQKLILVSWKQPIEVAIETDTGKHVVLKATGDQENVVGIDDSCLVLKVSAIEVRLSPEIFEGILLLVQFISTKVERLEFNHQKYQIVKSLQTLLDLQQKSYSLYHQEAKVNGLVRMIDALVYSGPALILKTYLYIGRVDLKLFDEKITRDIIESSIAQRKRMLHDFDDWTVIEDDSTSRPYHEDIVEDIERKENILKSLNVVVHLELKPIMVRQDLGNMPSMMVFIQTIMLLDGLTYVSMKENKQNYPTHFCELYSINHNQGSIDAHLKEKFEMKKCISLFRDVLKNLKKEGPFLELTQQLDVDPHGRAVLKTQVKVSSIILRLAMKTSKETFACLIRIVDSTLVRLDNISALFQQLREANTTEEMKVFHRMQSQKQSSQAQSKAIHSGSFFQVSFASIYVDVFHEGSYRLLAKVSSTEVTLDDNPAAHCPTQVECKNLQASYANKVELTKTKRVDDVDDKEKYFKILNLQAMQVKITQPITEGVTTTDIEVVLPTNERGRNLLFMIDLDSLSVIRDVMDSFSSLIAHSKSKTKFIFKDLTEYKNKQSEVPPRRDNEEWEKIGQKFPEIRTIREHFKVLGDQVTESFHLDEPMDDEKDVETSSEVIDQVKKKLDSTLTVLQELFIEKLPEKVTNLNIKAFVDKITVNIYQNFDHVSHSYISLKITNLLAVANIHSSSSETSRKSEKTFSTTSAMVSARSIKILDKTTGSLFKYLLKIPRHSLSLFFRSREVSEKSVKGGIELFKPTYLVETFNDRLAFVLDLNTIQIYLDDKSVNSLRSFTDRLLIILKASQPEESLLESERNDGSAKEGKFLLDYVFISKLSLQLQARSSTNLSLVNFVPDININLEEKNLELEEPTDGEEIVKYLLDEVRRDLSVSNIWKDNKANLPLLASFYTLCSSVNTIYCAVAKADSSAFFLGMKQLVVLVLTTCLKTGQFGLKSIGDVATLITKAAFNSKVVSFDKLYFSIEKLANKISGNKNALKSDSSASLKKKNPR